MTRAQQQERPHEALKHYVLEDMIDRGGMGEVYRARDTLLMRPVAIKFLKAEGTTDESARRFLREARAASALNHPNIVIIHEVGETDAGTPYIVQEFIEGRTLRHLVGESPTPLLAAEVVRQAARALAAAHAAGIIHRDIKPENIMLRRDGLVKVLDFGLARMEAAAADTSAFTTQAGMFMGTPAYMSPEQATAGDVGAAADVFSLGVVFHELLAGRPPFTGATPMNVVAAILTSSPSSLAALRPDVPRPVADLAQRMLEKAADLRPTAAEVERELTLLCEGNPVTATLPGLASRPVITVGRDEPRQRLLRTYAMVSAGTGRIVAVTGEPGIGKSSLMERFLAELAAAGERPVVVRGHCSENLAGSEAYMPVLEALDGLRRHAAGDSFDEIIRRLAPTWYGQLVTTAADPGKDTGPRPMRAASSERLKRELAVLFEEVSRGRTVVLVIDDLHWADLSTIDVLNYLAGRFSGMRLLILTAYRTSEMALAQHPFLAVRRELEARGVFSGVPLDLLSVEDVAEYLQLQFPGHELPESLAQLIHARTDGSPLFMVDLVRYLRDTSGVVEEDGTWKLAPDALTSPETLPATVRAMIGRKIERVAEEDRRLLEAAAIQGREFDSRVVGDALELDPLDVEERLETLERDHALIRLVAEAELPDRALTLRYSFVHVLYQNVLHDALRPTRRVVLSSRLARTLRTHHGNDAAMAGRVALLHQAAREFEPAARHFLIAARRAISLFAYREALSLAERGLKCLDGLPENVERLQLELGLQMVHANAVRMIRGWATPELEGIFARARELCSLLQDPPELFPVLWNLALFDMVRGDLRATLEHGLRLLDQAEAAGEPAFIMAAHHLAGVTYEFLGNVVESHRLLERARQLHDPARNSAYTAMFGMDPGMVARAMSSRPLWALGYPDQAVARGHETIALARQQRLPGPLVIALVATQGVHLYRGEVEEAKELGDEVIRLCSEYEFPQEAEWARGFQAAALTLQGRADEAIPLLQQSLEALRGMRSGMVRSMFLSLLGQAAILTGRVEEGLAATAAGFRHAERSMETGFAGELRRVEGELLLLSGDMEAAEDSLRQALEHARQHTARSFELRAATALARHLHATGRTNEARSTLQPVCSWFTEGHDTLDFREAHALLSVMN